MSFAVIDKDDRPRESGIQRVEKCELESRGWKHPPQGGFFFAVYSIAFGDILQLVQLMLNTAARPIGESGSE
jgi:hypothetical protein